MGKVLDKSKPILFGSYGQKKNLGRNSAIFSFKTKFHNSDPTPKMEK